MTRLIETREIDMMREVRIIGVFETEEEAKDKALAVASKSGVALLTGTRTGFESEAEKTAHRYFLEKSYKTCNGYSVLSSDKNRIIYNFIESRQG